MMQCGSVRSLDQGTKPKSRPRTIKKFEKRPKLMIKSVAQLATENYLIRSSSNNSLSSAQDDPVSMFLKKRNQDYYGSSESINRCQATLLAGVKSLQNLHQFKDNARLESRGLADGVPRLRHPSFSSTESLSNDFADNRSTLTGAKSVQNLHQFKASTRFENNAPLRQLSSNSMESIAGRLSNARTFANGSASLHRSSQSTNQSDDRFPMLANERLSRLRAQLSQTETTKQISSFTSLENPISTMVAKERLFMSRENLNQIESANQNNGFTPLEKPSSVIPQTGFTLMKKKLKQVLQQENLEKSKENESSQNGWSSVSATQRQQFLNRTNLNQEARSVSLMSRRAYGMNVENNLNSILDKNHFESLVKNKRYIDITDRLKFAAKKW